MATKKKDFIDTVAPKPFADTLQKPVEPTPTTPIHTQSPPPTTGVKFDTNSGKPSAFTYPDGRTIVGLSQKELDFLNKKYSGYKKPEETAPIPSPAVNPNALTPEQQSTIGQINPNIVNQVDPLMQDIAANLQGQQDYNKVLDYSGTPLENGKRNLTSITSRLVNPAVKILNKVSFGAGLGTQIVDELAKDKEVKRIINGFDTAQNVVDIRDGLKRAETLKDYALQQAKTDPIKAKQNYEEYISLKYKSLLLMKALSKDPKAFIEMQSDIVALTDYFDASKGIKALDDQALIEALNME